MNDADRETLENQILLRSTGELPPEENAALERVLAHDAEAAEFARFVAEKLPARAPRDFAAAAIRDAAPERNVIAFPRLWKLATAAAAVAVVSLVAVRFFAPDPPPISLASAPHPQRVTAEISARLDAIESDITASRQQLARGRHHRATDIL